MTTEISIFDDDPARNVSDALTDNEISSVFKRLIGNDIGSIFDYLHDNERMRAVHDHTVTEDGAVIESKYASYTIPLAEGDDGIIDPEAASEDCTVQISDDLAITVPYAGLPSPIQESGWSTGAFLAWGEEHLDELRAE
jgi:hypothetical protein